MKQVEILRESNESCAHACEVLESTNQSLHDKHDQLNADYNILQGEVLLYYALHFFIRINIYNILHELLNTEFRNLVCCMLKKTI